MDLCYVQSGKEGCSIFQPDGRKAGGAYVEVRGRVKRMDPTAGTIALVDGREIPIRHILLVDKEDTCGDTAENTK